MGDLVISLVLQKFGCSRRPGPSPAQVLVTVFDESSVAASLAIASELRRAGLKVALYPEATKLPTVQIRRPHGHPPGRGPGPDERLAGQVGVKNLTTGEQVSLPTSQACRSHPADACARSRFVIKSLRYTVGVAQWQST